MKRKGQTALEYLLMLAIVLSLMLTVVALTSGIGSIGASIGSLIARTRTQVIAWLMT